MNKVISIEILDEKEKKRIFAQKNQQLDSKEMVCYDENGVIIPTDAWCAHSKTDEQCLVDYYTLFNLSSLTVNPALSFNWPIHFKALLMTLN